MSKEKRANITPRTTDTREIEVKSIAKKTERVVVRRFIFLLTVVFLAFAGCINVAGFAAPDNFNREIKVFGVTIWATQSVTDTRLLHAGNVLAQYLDNDGDGEPDRTSVSSELAARNATILMFGSQSEAEAFDLQTLPSEITAVQFLLDSETN